MNKKTRPLGKEQIQKMRKSDWTEINKRKKTTGDRTNGEKVR
jgi:hypothetical protein